MDPDQEYHPMLRGSMRYGRKGKRINSLTIKKKSVRAVAYQKNHSAQHNFIGYLLKTLFFSMLIVSFKRLQSTGSNNYSTGKKVIKKMSRCEQNML